MWPFEGARRRTWNAGTGSGDAPSRRDEMGPSRSSYLDILPSWSGEQPDQQLEGYLKGVKLGFELLEYQSSSKQFSFGVKRHGTLGPCWWA